jgi:hypothetical protein
MQEARVCLHTQYICECRSILVPLKYKMPLVAAVCEHAHKTVTMVHSCTSTHTCSKRGDDLYRGQCRCMYTCKQYDVQPGSSAIECLTHQHQNARIHMYICTCAHILLLLYVLMYACTKCPVHKHVLYTCTTSF